MSLLRLSCLGTIVLVASGAPEWKNWIRGFGHDVYLYPGWIREEMNACECNVAETIECVDTRSWVRTGSSDAFIGFCESKEWLLRHMPKFDLNYLPPSVSIEGTSMLDDNIAFFLMAQNASKFSPDIPKHLKEAYILPYASYHEARVNWRPLFFAKFFQIVEGAKNTAEAMEALIAPNLFTNWTGFNWPDKPPGGGQNANYQIQWGSSTAPPIISPFSFVAYGYGSCTGWSTLLTFVARSVGIPARQVGTPCWNSGDFEGLAVNNPNVSKCWHGGDIQHGTVGGGFLNNHNWVEFWDSELGEWEFINVPPGTKTPNGGLCGASFDPQKGCGWTKMTGCNGVKGGPGAASRDHEIFAVTWSDETSFKPAIDGGDFVNVENMTLSNGDPVSHLVWSPNLRSPLGKLITRQDLRLINRTEFYRCKD
ncbi:hypothetical protein AAMO2058_001307500 [Amorphochlora amoebiformis]